MNKEVEEALKILTDVCAVFVGNLDQHTNIQKALKTIKDKVQEK